MLRVVVLAVAAACASTTPAPAPRDVAASRSPAPSSVQSSAGLLESVPFQVWPAHGGQTVGLLVVNQSRWGPTILWTRYLRAPRKPEGPGDPCYLYFADGKSANALYFPSKDGRDGTNFMPSWTVPLPGGKRSPPIGVAMMCPSIPNPHGLTADAHLVRLEVNGGAGAAPDLHFIATRVEVLDGSSAYPIVPARALDQARARFDRFVAARLRARALAIPAAAPPRHAAIGRVPPFGRIIESAQEGLFPTWDDAKGELSALFIRRVSRTRTRRYRALITPDCPPGAPCVPPHEDWIEDQVGASVDLAMRVVFDRTGTLVAEAYYDASPPAPPSEIAR
jgi:hypothetical protein